MGDSSPPRLHPEVCPRTLLYKAALLARGFVLTASNQSRTRSCGFLQHSEDATVYGEGARHGDLTFRLPDNQRILRRCLGVFGQRYRPSLTYLIRRVSTRGRSRGHDHAWRSLRQAKVMQTPRDGGELGPL